MSCDDRLSRLPQSTALPPLRKACSTLNARERQVRSIATARRASNRAAWLLRNRLLGPYVRAFLSDEGMPVRSKVIAIVMMWLTCGTSAWFFVPVLWGKALILSCALVGTVAVVRVKSRPVVDELAPAEPSAVT